jgi:hypothetical protein
MLGRPFAVGVASRADDRASCSPIVGVLRLREISRVLQPLL